MFCATKIGNCPPLAPLKSQISYRVALGYSFVSITKFLALFALEGRYSASETAMKCFSIYGVNFVLLLRWKTKDDIIT